MPDENDDANASVRVIWRKNARPRVSAIRSQSRVSRHSVEERRDMLRFLDADKIHRVKRDKVEKFSAPGSKTSGIPLQNPERVRGGRKSRKYRKRARNMRVGESAKIINTKWAEETRIFVDKDEARALHWQWRGQMDQVEEKRYSSWRSPKRKTQCWKV